MITVILAIATLGAGVAGMLGLGLVPLWIVTLASVSLALAVRLPRPLSLALASVGLLVVELGLLMLTPVLGAGMTVPHVVLLGAVSLVCSWFAREHRGVRGVLGDWRLALASSVGAGLFLLTMVATQIVPGALRLAWAMNGDTVNVMVFSRLMLAAGGIDQTAVPQPTPLPFAMAAASMEGGRSALADGALLEHDVARMAQLWVLMIALTCLLVGVIVGSTVRGASRRWSLAVTAVGSTIPLLWFVVGVQFEFGFINSAFAIVLLLCAWLFHRAGAGHPLLAFVGLWMVLLALLAVWSPLIICVIGLGVVLVVQRRRELLANGGARIAAAALAPVAFLAYAVFVTVPLFLEQSDALGSDGGFPDIPSSQSIIIGTVAVLIALVAWQRGDRQSSLGILAVLAGLGIGLTYLLLQRVGEVFYWGYYPAKFAWTTWCMLIPVIASIAIGFLADLRGRMRVLLTLSAGAVVASLLFGPGTPAAQLPLPQLVAGTAFNNTNEDAAVTFELSGSADGHNVLWRSQVGDNWPNRWLLQVDVPDPRSNPVRTYATLPSLGAEQVCEIVDLLGPTTVVWTADPAAEADLAATCPGSQYRVQLSEF